jgi:signal transduction histidine kinase
MSSVLVLDDRAADRELLTTLLGYAGHSVHEAATGEEALELARSERPDLIITDILMPTMNGYEFVRRLRSEPGIGSTPVVFWTANYAEDEVRRLAKACGVSHFIPKPSEPETIIATVGEVLGSPTRPLREVAAPQFDREQLRVLNDKVVQKVAELEASNVERQKLVVQVLQSQEHERQRLAEALHDDSVQAIGAVAMRLGMLADDVRDPEHSSALEGLRHDVMDTGKRLRRLIFELQPVELDRQGLATALNVYLERAREEDGLDFDLQDRMTRQPAMATRRLLYRTAQEAIVNVRKHAQASMVEVLLHEYDGGFVVTVRDDGKGFLVDEAVQVRPGHLGLPSMRERVETAGGSLTVESDSGGGSTLEIRMPEVASQEASGG